MNSFITFFRVVSISVLHVANFKYVKPRNLPSVQNKRIYFNINTGLELYCLQLAANLSWAFNRKKQFERVPPTTWPE